MFFIWEREFESSGYARRPEFDRARPGVRPFNGVGFTKHPRGPRIGYWNWDMPGLETAVHVDGTINDNKDRDRGWTVEMRIPWRSLEPLAMPDGRALPPQDGDEWRMDFSRFNQYKEAPPAKDPGGWAWSPHGVWDSHMPELFTHVRFSTEAPPTFPPGHRTRRQATVSAASPMRTEAEARARAEANRRARQEQRLKTGAPVELISDYVKANIGPVPASLGVSPFYKKYTDALGIPVIASDKVPDAALLVARDIVNTHARGPPGHPQGADRAWLADGRHRRSRDDDGHPGIREDEAARGPERRTGDAGGSRLPREPLTRPWRQPDNRRRGEPPRLSRHALLGRAHLRPRVRSRDHGGAIRDVDPAMFAEIRAAYDAAMAAGKYVHVDGRKHYATTNASEYWAEGVQWWFFSNYGECFAGNVKVETPEEFAAYDPALNELIGRVFTTPPHPDGRLSRQAHPPRGVRFDSLTPKNRRRESLPTTFDSATRRPAKRSRVGPTCGRRWENPAGSAR